MDEIPLSNSLKYPEQVNVRVEEQLKADIVKLKSHGVDVGELCRQALRRAAVTALEHIGEEAS